jgi:phage baseplate assembly protein W
MSQTRQIEVVQGDSLRAIAARELGDATRWAELAQLNQLRLPFLVESYHPEDRLPHTIIWGDRILIPWDSNGAVIPTPVSTLGIDIKLAAGRMVAVNGDLALVSGPENLIQAINHRIKTVLGEMIHHPRYGCLVSLALGLPTIPFASLAAANWVYEALREEPRIALIEAVDAYVEGDQIRVAARVLSVDNNTAIDLNLVLNP